MTYSAADTWLLDGFNDPVHGAQETFRAVLRAMSSPGQIIPIPKPNEHPSGITAAATAFLLTLAQKDLTAYFGFHTGAPITSQRIDATFALLKGTEDRLSLDEFSIGTAEYPDRAATLIIEVDTLSAPADTRLSGPGIETETLVGIKPCTPELWGVLIKNNALFPLGVDVIFSAPSGVMAIPRSTRIEVL